VSSIRPTDPFGPAETRLGNLGTETTGGGVLDIRHGCKTHSYAATVWWPRVK
jgi:hypothetical protein